MSDDDRTFESRVLDHYPDIRRAIEESAPFSDWLKTLTALDVDGEILYVRAGDTLRDRDQVMFEWARKNGMLTDAAIAHALNQEGE